MNELTTRLVLPPDVLLVPVRDLPASIYTLVDHQEGDYAITRLRARTPSRIVEGRAAELLKQFTKPATILEAVLACSYLLRLDPEKTLEDAYPLIRQLMSSSMLLPAGSAGAQEIQESFAVDRHISSFRVLRCLHCLEDTELYQVRHDRYGLSALKIARPGRAKTMAPLLGREAAILSHLDGSPAPRLLHASTFRARPFLAMEWRPGAHITVVAEELRMESGKASWRALLDLCSSLLDSYAQLHSAGVIHGDVHGSNILVHADHSVCVIDYGYSRWETARQEWGEPPRAGIAHFYEPEYARAFLERQPIPEASVASDQYALAALIYYCLSGSFYLEFSPEKEAMLRQIAEGEPLPLTSRGVRPCVNIGKVLRRALSKRPSGRFASVASFARRFRRAAQLDLTKKPAPATMTGGPEQVLLKAVLKRFAPESPLFVGKSLAAPTASVASGAAGIAYAFYRIACASENSRLLSTAELWASRARQAMDLDRAFYTDKLSPEVIGRVTPYHTASGIYCVEALLGHAAGDFARQESAMAGFLRRAAGECRNLDVTLGRSGTLLASCLLFEAARIHESLDTKPLKNFANRAMSAIWRKAGGFDRAQPSPAFDYLGMAHGWAGLLYATLRWCSCSGVSLPPQVEPSLRRLAACGERHGEGMRWPVLPADTTGGYMSGWCHGSAGYVHLWTEAYRLLGKTEFLALAESAAHHTWEVRPQVGHICCGLAGQAYGLLALFQQTKDLVWLQRARKLARLAAGAAVTPEYASSLYKGDVGVAILAAEIATPDDACMPFFGREGWL